MHRQLHLLGSPKPQQSCGQLLRQEQTHGLARKQEPSPAMTFRRCPTPVVPLCQHQAQLPGHLEHPQHHLAPEQGTLHRLHLQHAPFPPVQKPPVTSLKQLLRAPQRGWPPPCAGVFRPTADIVDSLWKHPFGADVVVHTDTMSFRVHRNIVEPESGWFRDNLPPPNLVRRPTSLLVVNEEI